MYEITHVIKDLHTHLEDSFLKWGGDVRMMTTKDLITHFGLKCEVNYLNKIIRNYSGVERFKDRFGVETVTTYNFPIYDPSDLTQSKLVYSKGRPWVFPAGLFVKSNIPIPPSQAVIQFKDKPQTPEANSHFKI